MRAKYILLLALFTANTLVSYILMGEVKKGITERYLFLTKPSFIPVPRDLQYGLSDLNFINTVAFIGFSIERGGGKLSKEEGLKVYRSLDAVTFYNPRYVDPYHIAHVFLTWDVGLYSEALSILKCGLKHLKDPRIAFYIGFIYFYFLNDYAEGAKYLELSFKLQNNEKSNLALLLASRLYYEEGRIRLAIRVIENQMKLIKNEDIKRALRYRLKDLKTALMIQQAIDKFRKIKGRLPKSLDELVKAGLVPPNLRDSAGGKFYITPDGKVRSEKVLFPIRNGGVR